MTLRRYASVLAVLPVLLSFLVMPASADDAKNPANVGMSNLQSCMANPEATLNVLYLMDISSSMKDSDTGQLRGPMMASTLDLFDELGVDAKAKVPNYDFVTFGAQSTSDNREIVPWTKLTSENLEVSKKMVEEFSLNKNAVGQGTDWLGGLTVAQSAIQRRLASVPTSCFVVLWMTDGQIDPLGKDTPMPNQADISSVNQICQSGGIADWYRSTRNHTLLLGALLNTNAGKSGTSVKERSINLFRSVVEGSSKVDADVNAAFGLGAQGGVFECGSTSGKFTNVGKMVTGKTASDLSWEFVNLLAAARNMVVMPPLHHDGKVEINPSVGKIEIYLKGLSQKPELVDAAGSQVCPSKSCHIDQVAGNQRLTIEPTVSGFSFGQWQINGPVSRNVKVFVGTQGKYKTLTLTSRQLADGPQRLIEGKSKAVDFTIQGGNGTKIDIENFSKISICLTSPLKADAKQVCSPENQLSDSFVSEITPVASDKAVVATAKVQLDGTNDWITISNVWPIAVTPSDSVAQIICDHQVDGVCDLGKIPNSVTSLSAVLHVTVKSGQSSVEIAKGAIQDSDSAPRTGKYVVTENASATAAAGKPADLVVHLSNAELKDSDHSCGLKGQIDYVVTTVDGQKLPSSLPVTWCVEHKSNMLWVFLIYILALLIGVLLPYFLLLMQARRSAAFPAVNFKWTSVPVKINSDGFKLGQNVSQESEALTYGAFVAPHRSTLSKLQEAERNSKVINIGEATLRVSPIAFNAFADLKVALEVPGKLLVSNRGSLADRLRLGSSSAEINLAGLCFFVAGVDVLEPVERSSFVEETGEADFDSEPGLLAKVSEMVPSEDDLVGQLFLVVTEDQNPNTALARSAQIIQGKKFAQVLSDLKELREARLAEAQAENERTPIVAPSTIEDSFAAVLDDDFDGFGTQTGTNLPSKSDPFDDGF